MEAVLDRKVRFRPILKPIQKDETLTYEILQQHKREQQAAGIIKKLKIVWGFTREERAEFEKGRTVEEVFDDIAHRHGF